MIIDTICGIVPLYHITYDARSVPFRPMLQKTFYLNDETDTCALGQALSHVLERGLTIYLHGDLGAGKTTLTRALIREAGHTGKVKSPTYTLVEPYVIDLNGQAVELLHFDLYRMGCPEEFLEAGFRDEVDRVVMVYAPEEVRIARAIQRDAASRESIVKRVRSQMDDEEKRKQADYVLVNDGETPLIPQVLALIASLSKNIAYLCGR